MDKETLAEELKRSIHEYATLLNHTSYHEDHIYKVRTLKVNIDRICDILIERNLTEKPNLDEIKEWLE